MESRYPLGYIWKLQNTEATTSYQSPFGHLLAGPSPKSHNLQAIMRPMKVSISEHYYNIKYVLPIKGIVNLLWIPNKKKGIHTGTGIAPV